MPEKQYFFFCDESGRLGYVDKPENHYGEITVVAGIIVDWELKYEIDSFCEQLYLKYGSHENGSKFHITDLNDSVKIQVREEIFDFISTNNILIVYGATYFQPLYREYENQREINEKSVTGMKARGIGLSKNLSMFKKLSQAEAFYNFYIKAMCCAIEHTMQPISATVITDNVDNITLGQYQKNILRTHTLSSHRTLKGRHYDYETKKVEQFSVSVNVETKDPMHQLLMKSEGNIEPVNDVTSIVSDVIANSVLYYLNEYRNESNFGALNCYEAIKHHPLLPNIIGLNSKSIDLHYPYFLV
jgi:hypothetical protein